MFFDKRTRLINAFATWNRIAEIQVMWERIVMFQLWHDDVFENIRHFDMPFPGSMVS